METHGNRLLADLTEAQQLAVTSTEGPVLVLAAAGSGKTRVITRRIAYLVLEAGIAPWEICAITFTNKAAGEMRERVGEVLSARQASAVTIGTFHSVCLRILREFGHRIDLKGDFVIYDASDQKKVVKDALKKLKLNDNFTPAEIHSAISNAKNKLIDAESYQAQTTDWYSKKVAEVYTEYDRVLRVCNALDFDDLLMKTAHLLSGDDISREELQARYQYLLIDEYQDTNHAQFVIAHALSAKHRNICVVGDPDQSIYGWRGATLSNILDFETHFSDAKTIELGQNYRSTPQILAGADELIKNNVKRKDKPLYTENADGDNIRVVHLTDEEHEAEQVVQWLCDHQREGLAWSEMGVLYRVNALSRVLEDALLRAKVPYQIARGTAFYQRKEVKDALAYLRVLVNPDDVVNMERIINTPARGIGNTTIQHLQAYAVSNGMSFWEAIQRVGQISTLNSRAVGSVTRFVKMLETWRKRALDYDETALGFLPGVRDVLDMIIRESKLESFYKDEKKGDEEKLANLYELISAGQRFDEEYEDEEARVDRRLADYLETVALAADVDGVEEGSGTVTLMTLHAAKGLEFPVVAMVGLEEGLLPHSRALDDPKEMEEERRLCFVGMTRAERHLMMSHAKYRTLRGLRERCVPSSFLNELPDAVLDVEDLAEDDPMWDDDGGYGGGGSGWGGRGSRGGYGKSRRENVGMGRANVSAGITPDGITIGTVVKHPKFGIGKVMSLNPAAAPKNAKVYFQTSGQKTLVLEYANLEVVDMDF